MGSRDARLALGAICIVVTGTAAWAQEAGDRVTPKSITDLKVRERVVDHVGPEDVLTVEQTEGDWLWVKSPSGTRGWIKRRDAEPVVAAQPVPKPTPQPAPRLAPPVTPQLPPEFSPRPAVQRLSATDVVTAQAAPEPADSDRLYLIGALGGSNVYTTYGYIGVLADGISRDLYSDDKVHELMSEVSGMCDNLTGQLKKVRSGGLAAEDAEAVERMIEIYTLLKQEADALTRFTDDRTQANADEFERIRTAVWPKIADLLGIEH